MRTVTLPPTHTWAITQVRQHIGYCPQFGALLERLTARELLTVFARLRGIPEHSIKAIVESEIQRIDLTKHADKQCGKYRYTSACVIIRVQHGHLRSSYALITYTRYLL